MLITTADIMLGPPVTPLYFLGNLPLVCLPPPPSDSVKVSLIEAKRLLSIDIHEALNTSVYSSEEMDDLFDYLIQFSVTADLCPLYSKVWPMVENILLTSLANKMLRHDDDDSEIALESVNEEQMTCFKNISSPYVADFTNEIVSIIQRFLLDYEVYVRSIQLANEVITTVKFHRFSPSCMIALTKLKHCAYCGGFAKFKPCLNLCLNTLRGCMADVSELHDDFENFTVSFQTLSREMDSSFEANSLATNQLQRFVSMIPEFRRQSTVEYLVS